MASRNGEVEVRVVSAEELDRKTSQKLEAAVKGSKLAAGRKLKVTPRVSFWCVCVRSELWRMPLEAIGSSRCAIVTLQS